MKNMAGEDLERLKMKELQQLEKQLQKGIKKICDRKVHEPKFYLNIFCIFILIYD